jgi:hypothetical protein
MIKLVNLLNEATLPIDMIKKLALEMGETVTEAIGAGANGVAYATTSGKVVKLTNDPAEVALATRLRTKRLYKHIVNVYDVRPIENLNDNYIIIMDRVTPFHIGEESQWFYIRKQYFDRKFSDKDFTEFIAAQPKQTSNRIIDPKFIEKITQQRTGVLRDFSELRIVWDEAHGGNMGWNRHGNLVHFDAWQEEHYTKGYRTRFNGEPIRRDDGKLDTEVNDIPYERGLAKPLQSFKDRNN